MIAFLFILLIGIPLALLRGLVLSDLIGWFTPFHLTVVQAIGISIIVALFTSHLAHQNPRKPETSLLEHGLTQMFGQLLIILFAWLLGYIWHLFL